MTLKPDKPGLWQASLATKELGLWRATDGKLTALVNVGPANPREFQEVTSTTERAAEDRRGDRRLGAAADERQRARHPARGAGAQRHAFRRRRLDRSADARRQSVVRGIGVLPIFAGLIGLLLLIGSLAAAWAREGR